MQMRTMSSTFVWSQWQNIDLRFISHSSNNHSIKTSHKDIEKRTLHLWLYFYLLPKEVDLSISIPIDFYG